MFRSVAIKIKDSKVVHFDLLDHSDSKDNCESMPKIIDRGKLEAKIGRALESSELRFFDALDSFAFSFSEIDSSQIGSAVFTKHTKNRTLLTIEADAQDLFSHVIFELLSDFNVISMALISDFADNYRFTLEPKQLFFKSFSTICTESSLSDKMLSLSDLKAILIQRILNNLTILEKLIHDVQFFSSKGESLQNALVSIHSQFLLTQINLDSYIQELKENSHLDID